MIPAPSHYIWCPGCECVVRELDDTPCLNCHRCPFCGRKLKSEEMHCTCGLIDNPEDIDRLTRNFGISESQLPRERRRAEIRKQLEFRKAISAVFVGSVVPVSGMICGALLGERMLLKVGVFAVACGFAVVATTYLVPRVFRRIEDLRLETEIPSLDDDPEH